MNITETLTDKTQGKRFSFEILPPLKGNGTQALFATLDELTEANPLFINITTHHSEYVYKEMENGLLQRLRVRRRPGTIAIAATIQNRYHVPVIPHVICSGVTREDIEYELIDLQFWASTQSCYSVETRQKKTTTSSLRLEDTRTPLT